MDIKLIPVEKGSKFTFPALPEKVQGKYAAKYQSFDIISLGTVKVPKGTDVSEFSWDGVFFGASKKNEAIVKTNAWKSPNECVKILNDYMFNGNSSPFCLRCHYRIRKESLLAKITEYIVKSCLI